MSTGAALRALAHRVRGLWRRDRADREFLDELACHVQLHTDDNIRAGMPPVEARRRALASLGGVAATRQARQERASLPLVAHVAQDVKYAGRQLARHPGFAVSALLLLGLGTGAALTIFAFVDAALLRPLPYPDPQRLLFVTESTPQIPRANLSYHDFLDWKRQATTIDGLAVFSTRRSVLGTAGGAEVITTARVSAGFFGTLGVSPILGRDFRAGEDLPDAPPAALLGYGTWQAQFGGDPAIVGRTVALSGVTHTVLGVLPQGLVFAPAGDAGIWTSLQPNNSCDRRRSCHPLYGIARLKPHASLAAARSELESIAAALERQYPDSNRGQGAVAVPLSEVVVGRIGPLLWALLGGAALLLLIACANVSGLLLVRAESRGREFAVRRALGASRRRLAFQLFTEGLLLAVAGTAAGFAAARFGAGLLLRLVPAEMAVDMPFLRDVHLGSRSVVLAGGVAAIAAVVFAFASLRRSWSEGSQAGIGERGGTGRGWRALGARLVVAELAMALVLLTGAGLLARSVQRLLSVDLHFTPEQLATVRVTAPRDRYDTDAKAARLVDDVVDRVAALPGVTAAGVTSVLPVSFNGNTTWLRFVGRPYDGEHNEVNLRDVSPAYFRALGAPLLAGRAFTRADVLGAPRVAIINRELARLYFPGADPLGTQVGDTSLSPSSIATIVGIVDDVREGGLEDSIWPAIYYPIAQSTDTGFSVVARVDGPALALLPPITTALRQLDPELGLFDASVMTDRIQSSMVASVRRSSAWLAGAYAAVALILSILGVYAVVAYSVSRRTREIGVRLALGAQPRTVSQMVLREAVGLTAAGLVVGLLCAVISATLMRNLLFGTAPWDPATLVGMCLLLGIAAVMASAVPARRASAVDPVTALRGEG